jgi:hypothetical protein
MAGPRRRDLFLPSLCRTIGKIMIADVLKVKPPSRSEKSSLPSRKSKRHSLLIVSVLALGLQGLSQPSHQSPIVLNVGIKRPNLVVRGANLSKVEPWAIPSGTGITPDDVPRRSAGGAAARKGRPHCLNAACGSWDSYLPQLRPAHAQPENRLSYPAYSTSLRVSHSPC